MNILYLMFKFPKVKLSIYNRSEPSLKSGRFAKNLFKPRLIPPIKKAKGEYLAEFKDEENEELLPL